MERPRREKFILDVRRSARTVQKPEVEADSDAMDADAITKILHRAALWLTPKVAEHYRPKDFADWPKDQQARLELAVQEFRKIAGPVPRNEPLTVDQFMEGARCFRELVNVLGEMVRLEWMQAIGTIEKQAEEWSAEVEWRTRRVNKKTSESLIGTYEVPQLLIFAEPKSIRSRPCRALSLGDKDRSISRFSPRTTRRPCIETMAGNGSSTWRFAMASRKEGVWSGVKTRSTNASSS